MPYHELSSFQPGYIGCPNAKYTAAMRFTMNEIRRQGHNKRSSQGSVTRMFILVMIIAALIFYFAYKFS
jgi:hypothetical protein